MENAAPESFPCVECQAGLMHLRSITYFTWLDGELVTVPNFPAWVCDVCGRREYDQKALLQLNMLLSPEAGQSPRRKASRRRAPRPAPRPPLPPER